ncbi:MAG: serine dehydratase beta chain, partial [Acidimicrobiia bacterium]
MSVVGVLDLFRIGIGPSSSHTVGPMRAARRFAEAVVTTEAPVSGVRVQLFGSLGATGVGHGTVPAVVLGLSGAEPERIDPDEIVSVVDDVRASGRLHLAGAAEIAFDVERDVVLAPDELLPGHPNGMRFTAIGPDGDVSMCSEYYSIGGGFVATADELDAPIRSADQQPLPHPFRTAAELVATCRAHGMSVAELALANERARRPDDDVRTALAAIWRAMRRCVDRGCATDGVLPGGLGVQRRAAAMHRSLTSRVGSADPLTA